MAIEGLEDIIPEKKQEIFLQGRNSEIKQALMDLGYWLPGANLDMAIQNFRTDYRNYSLIQGKDYQQIGADPFTVDGMELRLLHLYCSLDGEFIIDRLPQLGEQNLVTRVLHYRLEILGLYQGMIHANHSQQSLEALKSLHLLLPSTIKEAELLKLSGNIPQLLKKLLHTGKLNQRIVVFKYENPELAPDTKAEITEEEETESTLEELEQQERDIDKELKQLAGLSKFELKAIDKNLKGNEKRSARLERVKAMINALVDRENQLLQKHLKGIASLQKILNDLKASLLDQRQEIQKSKTEIKTLDKAIRKIQIQIDKKGNKESIRVKIENIQNRTDPELKNFSLSELVKKHKSSKQKLDILNKNISGLQNEINGLSGGKERRKKKKELEKFKRERPKIESHFFGLSKEIEFRKAIEKLVANLKKIQPLEIERRSLNDRKALVQARIIMEEQTKKELEKSIKKQKGKIKQAEKKKNQDISAQQKNIIPLKSRMIALQEKISNFGHKFKNCLRESLSSEFYEELRREVFLKHNTAYLEKIHTDPVNIQLIRLIQVHQWTNGYYYGILDNDFKKRTFDSVREICEDVKQLNLKFVLTMLGDHAKGYWILNIHYFFKAIIQNLKLQKKANAETVLTMYEKKSEGLEKKEAFMDGIWNDFNETNQEDLLKPQIRRIYYGVKSMATSIVRCFGRLVRFILSAIGKGIYILHNFIKFLYKELREGMIKFGQGMAFLFGKRQLETAINSSEKIITKFDFDFDAYLFSPTNISSVQAKQHADMCIGYANNLNFSLQLVGKVINWVIRGGVSIAPVGWLRLAIRIAVTFKRLIKAWLAQLTLQKKPLSIGRNQNGFN